MADRRLLLIQASGPPYPGGTNVILKRLLEGLPGWSIDVAVNLSLRRFVRRGDPLALNAGYRYFPRLPPLPRLAPLAHLGNGPLALLAGLRLGWAARCSGVHCLVTAVDGGFSQVAATVAARIARRPLVVLVFDLWEENAYGRIERLGARVLERRILRSAADVVVFGEEAAEHYRRKHGLEALVLRIPLPVGWVEEDAANGIEARDTGDAETDRRDEVLVAGAVYWAQEDAVRRIAEATARVDRARLTLVGDESTLRARGVVADRYEPRLSGDKFRNRIRRASVVALGLSFGSKHPDIIRTATPARLVDYMAAGTPLLVHAPAGSHVAEYARREDFAEVVSEASVEAVAAGIERVIADPDRARRRADRGRELAATVHDGAAVRERFREILATAADDRGAASRE